MWKMWRYYAIDEDPHHFFEAAVQKFRYVEPWKRKGWGSRYYPDGPDNQIGYHWRGVTSGQFYRVVDDVFVPLKNII